MILGSFTSPTLTPLPTVNELPLTEKPVTMPLAELPFTATKAPTEFVESQSIPQRLSPRVIVEVDDLVKLEVVTLTVNNTAPAPVPGVTPTTITPAETYTAQAAP